LIAVFLESWTYLFLKTTVGRLVSLGGGFLDGPAKRAPLRALIEFSSAATNAAMAWVLMRPLCAGVCHL
jgi:hypothetical protein